MTNARNVSKILNLMNLETNKVVSSAYDSDSISTSINKGAVTPVGTITASSADALPVSPAIGTQAVVTSTGRFYIFNGSGWYNIATVNSTPYWDSEAAASYTLPTDGTSIIVEVLANDSDGTAITYSATGDSNFNTIATVAKDSDNGRRFIIRSIDSEGSASPTAGSGILTFRASDGIDQASTASTFSITFSADWSSSITQIRKDGTLVNGMLGNGAIATNSDGTYAVLNEYGSSSLIIFTRSGSTWTQQTSIAPTSGVGGVTITASGIASSVNLNMTDDGSRFIAGAVNSASAYVYVRTGSTWALEQEFTTPLVGYEQDFGWAADISGDGNYIIISDRQAQSPYYGGQAWVWSRSGSTWTLQATLTQPSGASNYGMDAKINKDGTYAIVGDWTHGSDAGRVHVWKRTGTSWAIETILTSSDLATGDRFGEFVDINDAGDYVAVAATYDDDAGTTSGSVYVFSRSGSTWTQQAKLVPAGRVNPYRWGKHVSIDGSGTFIVSYILDNGGTNDNDAIVFTRSGSSWSETVTLAGITGTEAYAGGITRPTFSRDGFWIISSGYNQNAADGTSRAGALYSYNV